MAQSLTLLFALLSLLPSIFATTLTYKMAPHEKACFYSTAERVGEKMAFYFAVISSLSLTSLSLSLSISLFFLYYSN
jgi:hypothetical protein